MHELTFRNRLRIFTELPSKHLFRGCITETFAADNVTNKEPKQLITIYAKEKHSITGDKQYMGLYKLLKETRKYGRKRGKSSSRVYSFIRKLDEMDMSDGSQKGEKTIF